MFSPAVSRAERVKLKILQHEHNEPVVGETKAGTFEIERRGRRQPGAERDFFRRQIDKIGQRRNPTKMAASSSVEGGVGGTGRDRGRCPRRAAAYGAVSSDTAKRSDP